MVIVGDLLWKVVYDNGCCVDDLWWVNVLGFGFLLVGICLKIFNCNGKFK